jgi:hypothetical protein
MLAGCILCISVSDIFCIYLVVAVAVVGRFIIGGGSERYFIETIDLEERF